MLVSDHFASFPLFKTVPWSIPYFLITLPVCCFEFDSDYSRLLNFAASVFQSFQCPSDRLDASTDASIKGPTPRCLPNPTLMAFAQSMPGHCRVTCVLNSLSHLTVSPSPFCGSDQKRLPAASNERVRTGFPHA